MSTETTLNVWIIQINLSSSASIGTKLNGQERKWIAVAIPCTMTYDTLLIAKSTESNEA